MADTEPFLQRSMQRPGLLASVRGTTRPVP
jgi:hypothetical protein